MESSHYIADDKSIIFSDLDIVISGLDSQYIISPKLCSDYEVVYYVASMKSSFLSVSIEASCTISDLAAFISDMESLGRGEKKTIVFPSLTNSYNTNYFKLSLYSPSISEDKWSVIGQISTPFESSDILPRPIKNIMEMPNASYILLASHHEYGDLETAMRSVNEVIRIVGMYKCVD